MTRILTDLPDEDIQWLDQFAVEQGRSRDAVLSMIIHWYGLKIEGRK